ncbi:MAG: helix-turn-helix transcriptional regulator [Acidimicrobiales bacterium]
MNTRHANREEDREEGERRDQSLPALLLKLRRKRQLSARDLAEKADVHHSTVTMIERGQIAQPRADKLTRLARALGTDPSDFLTLAGYKPTEQLPSFGVYLRATTDLPAHAVEELKGHFDYLASRHGATSTGPLANEDEVEDLTKGEDSTPTKKTA